MRTQSCSSSPRPWWHPEAVAARRSTLIARAKIIGALRKFFDEQDFLEVETPCLQVSPGLEPHLHAFATRLTDPQDGARELYLRVRDEKAFGRRL
jgi:lysyl-tRNA synthetase class 2